MKYSIIAAGTLLALGNVSLAQAADSRSAQVNVFEEVQEECNIGLKFAGNDEAGLGNTGLSSGFHTLGEINFLDGGALQLLSGAVKCNSANGYQVNVTLEKGALVNGANLGESVGYAIAAGTSSANFSQTFISQLVAATGIYPVGTSTSTAQENFQLKLTADSFSGVPAGTYSEDITFTIVTL